MSSVILNTTAVVTGVGLLMPVTPLSPFALAVTAAGAFTATVILETSPDNVTWTGVKTYTVAGTNAVNDTTFSGGAGNSYVRARVTAITGQSTNVTVSVNIGLDTYNTVALRGSTDANSNLTGIVNPKDGRTITGFSTLRDKIRKAYTDQASKPYYSSFWNLPVAWAGSTLVYGGECRSSNGNWYIALAGGTTGVNAPNLTNPLMTQPYSAWNDGAVDGSGSAGVNWVYYSAAQPVYNRDLGTTCSVTFSATTDATLTNIYTPVTGALAVAPTGFVRDGNTNNTKQFRPTGAGNTATFNSWVGDLIKSPNAGAILVTQTSGGALGMQAISCSKDATYSVINGVYFEFNTDSNKIQFATSQFDSGVLSNYGTKVLVDDVEVSPSRFFATAAITGGLGVGNLYTLVTMAGVKKVRNIKIYGTNSIRDIRIDPNSSLYAVKENPLKVLWIGDSISAGSAVGPAKPDMTWAQLTWAEMGLKGIVNASVGGTGFESSASGYNFLQRVTESVSANNPPNSISLSSSCNVFDVIVIQISGNDGASSTTLQAQQLATFQQLRLLQPDALIIVHGAYAGTGSYNAAADWCDSKAQLAFAQWNDAKSLYVKTRADAAGGAWLTGTGYNKVGFTSATGNTSYYVGNDSLHPNDAGSLYLAKRTVDAIYQALSI